MGKGFAVLEVDPEFKALIRPLRKDEYLQLEVNLSIDGCRDPIITWNNIIIDGHNRYEICNRLHIPYAVREMPFENREHQAHGGDEASGKTSSISALAYARTAFADEAGSHSHPGSGPRGVHLLRNYDEGYIRLFSSS